MPYNIALILRKFAIRSKDIQTQFGRIGNQAVLEEGHLLAPPAGNRTVIQAHALVRDNQVLADAADPAQTTADRTGTQRTVETEQVVVALTEDYAVQLKAIAELSQFPAVHRNRHSSVTPRKCFPDA